MFVGERGEQLGGPESPAGGAAAPRLPEARALAGALAVAPVEDDGSLRARLWDHAGLADSMLGVSLLDLFVPGPDPGPGRDPVGLDDLRRDHDPRPDAVRVLLDVRNAVTRDDLDATVAAVGEVFRAVNRLESLAALLLERARVQSLRTDALLNPADPHVARASSVRRHELARRALVADLAIETHHTEAAMAQRLTDAQALVACAPRTLSAALAGGVTWRNAARVADTVAELDPRVAARFDERVAHRAAQQNPAQFARTARRILEQVHPTPAEVRHAEAATKRHVALAPAKDGMAYLTLFTTAPAAHAILDRVSRVARTTRASGDARTQEQLRADVTTALLLDDGTLDVHATAPGSTAADDDPPSDRTASESSVEVLPAAGTLGDRFSLARIARSLRPQVFVTVPVLTLLGRIDEPGLLDGTVPIDAETAREMAGLATSFTRLLTQPHTGKVLAVGAETYRPPADLRHYVMARDGTCRFPGCTRRAVETDTDHTVATADGGRTTARNLAPLCRRHHVLKHQARYTVVQSQDGDGAMTWTTPTGRRVSTRPSAIPATVHTRRPSYAPVPDETGSPPDDHPPPF